MSTQAQTNAAGGDWKRRANELQENTPLTERQSEVAALREKGYTIKKISEILGIQDRTAIDHSRLVNKQYKMMLQGIVELDSIIPEEALDLEGELAPVLDLERVQELIEEQNR